MAEEIVVNVLPAVCNNRLPRRIKLNEQQLEKITLEELIHNWHEQDLFIDILESQVASQDGEIANLRESEERLRQQHSESSHREKVLVRRLATKEQEMQEYASQIAEFKAGQTAGSSALRSALLDPAVNLLLQLLRGELLSTRSRLEETQNELSAWKFTPDSNTGKRLMAKCRLLYQENEELGRMISSGRLAKLEGELALQKSFSDEVKKSQSELDEFLQDLDEDVEGMQSTIYYLQQELRKSKEAFLNLQQQKNNLHHEVCNGYITTNKATFNGSKDVTISIPVEMKSESEEFSSPVLKDKLGPVSPAEDAGHAAVEERVTEGDEVLNGVSSDPSSLSEEVDVSSSLNLMSDDKVDVVEKATDPEESSIAYSETAEAVTEAAEVDNSEGNGTKVEMDDQDSQGELMIEVSSEPRDTVDEEEEEDEDDDEDDDDDDENYGKTSFGEKLVMNGGVHLEAAGVEGVILRRRKRVAVESSPTSSDEDSDDTPLIKKVRRHAELVSNSKA